MSLLITKTRLMEIIKEEIAARLIDEGFPQLFQTAPEEEEEPEETQVSISDWDEVPIKLGDDEGEFEPVELRQPPRWARTKALQLLALYPDIPASPTTILDMAWQFVAHATAQDERPEGTTPLEKTADLGAQIKEGEGYDPAGTPQISKEDLETIRDYTIPNEIPYASGEKIAIHFINNYGVPATEAVRLLRLMDEMEQGQAADPAIAQYIKEELEGIFSREKEI